MNIERDEFQAFSDRIERAMADGFSGIHARLDALNGRTRAAEPCTSSENGMPHRVTQPVLAAAALVTLLPAGSAQAQGHDADALAKQLANPVSSLISVPFQNNLDWGVGPSEKARYTLNIQPVVPLPVSENWNLIVRTILPVVGTPAPSPGPTITQGASVGRRPRCTLDDL